MIELAPQSKNGLPLRTPVTAGSGSCGLGSDWPPGLGPQQFGAVVTTPLTLAPRRGSEQPRLAEIPGGFVLDTGGHNPGLRRTLRENSEAWARLQVPLIVALSPGTPEDWTRLAERLEEIATVAALELHLPEGVRPSQAAGWVAGVRRAIAVPLLARLPVTGVGELAPACASAGADTLVVGTPPLARARTGSGWVEGPSAGPAAFPYTMRALRLIRRAAEDAGIPLVAAGGISSAEDVGACLEAGASAVQLRSLLWVDPAAAARIAGAWLSQG